MREWLLAALLIVAMLLPTASISRLDSENPRFSIQGRAEFNCTDMSYDSTTDLPVDSALFGINDDRCTALWLEGFQTGDMIHITLNVSAGLIDVLMMDAGVYLGYLNGQPYHKNPLSGSALLEPDPSFENLSGTVDYHWTVPSTESWILVLDNMRHQNDGGRGAGGGGPADAVISLEHDVETWLWKPLKTVIQVEAGTYAVAGDDPLVFDEGDVITLRGEPLFGKPDIFLMTDAQMGVYISGSPGSWNIEPAQLTALSSADQVDWTVSAEFAGEEIHIIVDARSTPAGGGDGSQDVAVTVSLLVNPVIAPMIEITSQGSNEILLGDMLNLDASSTPNRWGQISSFSWSIDDNGVQNTVSANAQWDAPGTYDVNLTVTRIDGQQATSSTTIDVVDVTAPSISLLGIVAGALIEQGSSVSVTCNCDDDHMLGSVDWYWDGVLDGDNDSILLSRQLETSTIGSHHLRIVATDPSGNSAEVEVNLTIVDATDPVITAVIWPDDDRKAGTMLTFSLSASDPENPDISIRWDFDLGADTDGDGNKRNDWVAGSFDSMSTTASAEHVYTSKGVYSVLVQVVNSEGRKVEMTHTVVVAAPPPPESPKWMYGIGAVMIIGLLGAGGFFAWSQIKLRAERLELEGHNLTQEERDELEASRVVESLYGESQQTSLTAVAAMPAAAGASGWEGPPSAEQSYESIAGMGSLQSAQPVTSDIGQDMLDALVDEPQSQPESKPEVDGDLAFLDDLKDSTSSVQQPSQPAATGAGLAIDIPGLAKAPEARPKGSLKIELPSQPSAPQPGASEPGAPQPGASEPGTPTPDDLDI